MDRSVRSQEGVTLIELLAVVAIAALVLMITAVVSLPALSRESARSAAYDIYSHLQLSKVEAASRSNECRFEIDLGQRRLRVFDTLGTASPLDDQRLHEARLDETVTFARPDAGPVVTLDFVSGTTYRAVFATDGTVRIGPGLVHLFGGDQFLRVELLAAGGVEVARWRNGAWQVGG